MSLKMLWKNYLAKCNLRFGPVWFWNVQNEGGSGWTNLLNATSEFSQNDCYMNQVYSELAQTAAFAQVSREHSDTHTISFSFR